MGGILPQKQERACVALNALINAMPASAISAVHGWTVLEPGVGAPFAVPSIAAGAGIARRGARRKRALAKQYRRRQGCRR